jgi:spermidine/putrescine transport system ATP-binding protein
MGDFLEFQDISKHFGATRAVDHVSFGVKKGEFFSLLGPSGCGKTTLLRLLAGFEQPDGGRLILDGEDITALPPHKRPVNTVFQNYALFPHLTVRENIAFGPRVAKWPRAKIDDAVAGLLKLTQMEEKADRKPHQISGGQKQRVAIARALINKPRVLLLDEPLAALDLKLRQHMLLELDLIHDEVGITFLYVTHDQTEAMSLSDRIAVMNNGRVEQIGAPAEIYETPVSGFVAAFIGDTNFFDGRVTRIDDEDPNYCLIEVAGLPELVCYNDKQKKPGDLVHLSIRPEKFHISNEQPQSRSGSKNAFRAKVEDVIYMGTLTKYWVRIQNHRLAISQPHGRFLLDEKPPRWGDEVWIWFHADDGYMLDRFNPSEAEQAAGIESGGGPESRV